MLSNSITWFLSTVLNSSIIPKIAFQLVDIHISWMLIQLKINANFEKKMNSDVLGKQTIPNLLSFGRHQQSFCPGPFKNIWEGCLKKGVLKGRKERGMTPQLFWRWPSSSKHLWFAQQAKGNSPDTHPVSIPPHMDFLQCCPCCREVWLMRTAFPVY